MTQLSRTYIESNFESWYISRDLFISHIGSYTIACAVERAEEEYFNVLEKRELNPDPDQAIQAIERVMTFDETVDLIENILIDK